MALRSIPRLLQLRHFATKAADPHYDLLLLANRDLPNPNLERSLSLALTNSKSKLEPSAIDSVLRRCTSSTSSADRLTLLRFFVWSGQQAAYRHSAATYSKACERIQLRRHPDTLMQLLDDYSKEGSPLSVRTFKILLDLCRQANLPEQALVILRRMEEFGCRPDTPSYNAVLRLLVNRNGGGNADVAAKLLKEMALAGIQPDNVTYVMLVKGFCSANRLDDAQALVDQMRNHGCLPNVVVYSALLDGACKCGDLKAAMKLLGEMEHEVDGSGPNVVTYTCLINCLCEKTQVNEALGVLDRMATNGCCPNRVTIATLLKALCKEMRIEEAYALVERVVADGSVSRNECFSTLISCFLTSENLEEAEKLMGWMLATGVRPDRLACNSLIRFLCSRGLFLDGFKWTAQMSKEGLSLDSDVYSTIIFGLCEGGQSVEAASVVRWALDGDVNIDSSAIDALVELLKKCGETDLSSQIVRNKEQT